MKFILAMSMIMGSLFVTNVALADYGPSSNAVTGTSGTDAITDQDADTVDGTDAIKDQPQNGNNGAMNNDNDSSRDGETMGDND